MVSELGGLHKEQRKKNVLVFTDQRNLRNIKNVSRLRIRIQDFCKLGSITYLANKEKMLEKHTVKGNL